MKRIIGKLIVLVVIVLSLYLINWLALLRHVRIRMDDSVDFGNQYRYVMDYPQALIYHETEEYEGSGGIIVPGFILKYNFNHDNIFLQNRTLESKDTLYWIIDKATRGTMSFKDSSAFVSALKSKGIEMKFLDFPYFNPD